MATARAQQTDNHDAQRLNDLKMAELIEQNESCATKLGEASRRAADAQREKAVLSSEVAMATKTSVTYQATLARVHSNLDKALHDKMQLTASHAEHVRKLSLEHVTSETKMRSTHAAQVTLVLECLLLFYE